MANVARQHFDRGIVAGPMGSVVWKLAWPTMLQNVIGGLQGLVDHAMVGHFVGYTGNAAIGVSWQIFLVIVVFISSVFTGMGVMVARFAGAQDPDRVNHVVYQAFITAVAFAVLIAPVGYLSAPFLLDFVNATEGVKLEALPYLRIMFTFSAGMLLFFMLGGAFRSAGDARTPLSLGLALTLLNVVLNAILIPGVGPVPAFGTRGAALGTVIAGGVVALAGIWLICGQGTVVRFSSSMGYLPNWGTIRSLFRFGVPAGLQGVAMNVAGVLLLRFVGSLPQSAYAQAAYAVGYTQLFSLITWTSVGLMSATAVVAGQNLGARRADRAARAPAVTSRFGLLVAAFVGLLFVGVPGTLLQIFGMTDPEAVALARQLLRYLSVSGLFVTVALAYTGALQGTGDTRGPLYISVISQIVVPLGICWAVSAVRPLASADIWLAIVCGHATRCALSIARFRQGKWQHIEVDVEPARGV